MFPRRKESVLDNNIINNDYNVKSTRKAIDSQEETERLRRLQELQSKVP